MEGRDANTLLQCYTDILPGRPTSVEHRAPQEAHQRVLPSLGLGELRPRRSPDLEAGRSARAASDRVVSPSSSRGALLRPLEDALSAFVAAARAGALAKAG